MSLTLLMLIIVDVQLHIYGLMVNNLSKQQKDVRQDL